MRATRATPLLMLLCGQSALARTVHVVGTTDSVQDAIDAAAEGDLVLLEAGTHTACPVISGKRVDLVGAGSASTILDCSGGATRALTIDATTVPVRLAGFDLRNATGAMGLLVTDASVTITDLRLVGFSGSDGPALQATAADLVVADSLFEGNVSSSNGGAVWVSGSNVRLSRTTFTGNESLYDDGGALWSNDSFVEVRDSTFSSNVAYSEGGAIASFDGGSVGAYTYLLGVTLEGNQAVRGGAVYGGTGTAIGLGYGAATATGNSANDGGAIYGLGVVYVYAAEMTGNSATNRGGAVFAETVGISASRVTDNTAGAGGGAVYAGGSGDANGSIFAANQVTAGDGGAIQLDGGSWSSANCWYTGNMASNGGAIHATDTSVSDSYSAFDGNTATTAGGALHLTSASYYDFTGTRLTANTAGSNGGALWVSGGFVSGWGAWFEGNSAAGYGGAAYVDNAYQTWDTSRFTGNQAKDGGAIAQSGTSLGASHELALYRTHLDANEATGNGAAVWLKYGAFTAESSWIVENTGATSGAVYTTAGTTHRLAGNLFCRNAATAGSGGGLLIASPYLDRYSYDNAFVQNTASQYGGGVYELNYTTSGTPYSYTYGATFVGNVAAAGPYDGHAAQNVTAYVYDSVFQGNDEAALSSTSTSSYAHEYYGSLFWDHSVGATWQDDTSYLSASWLNYVSDPLLASWSNDADCWNDDLLNGVTTSGWNGLGVGANAGFTWRAADDADGDGVSILQGDCDDGDRARHRGATETHGDYTDEDCEGGYGFDGDGDGYLSDYGQDCDDADAAVHPGAADTPYDGVDQDCDGWSEDDADRDGFAAGIDCDDADPGVNPLAAELPYDGIDQDCDGADADADGDGHVSDAHGGDDCDDTHDFAYPGAPVDDWYDGVDADCAGDSDFDQDGDGEDADFGGGTDCDDLDPTVNSLGTEVWYNEIDEDCDGNRYDQDGDGHDWDGVDGGTDCDDLDPDVNPDAPEQVNGKDDDCDGEIEVDSDGDGIVDTLEDLWGTDPGDGDSDGDGLSDGDEWGSDLETPLDTDGDGSIDALDLDSDDAVPDAEESDPDADGDGYRELRDSDGDGASDNVDFDDDGDGIPTADEGADDLDGDGVPNHLDDDSDGDSVADAREPGDNDGDGIPDHLDAGSDTPGRAPLLTEYGCGCNAAPSGGLPGLLALLLGLAGVRRRR